MGIFVAVILFSMIACEGPMGPQGEKGEMGDTGNDGISIFWVGEFTGHPEDPQQNWAYYNTIDKIAYIYNGLAWQILAMDGIHGRTKFEGTRQTPSEVFRFVFYDNAATCTYNGGNWLRGVFTYTDNTVIIVFSDCWENNQWTKMPGPTIIRIQYDNFEIKNSFNVSRYTEENQWEPGKEWVQNEYHVMWKYE